MEEEYDGLQQTASRAESQLQDTQTNLEDRKVFCQQLQEECDTMTEHVGGWAEKQRQAILVHACVYLCLTYIHRHSSVLIMHELCRVN